MGLVGNAELAGAIFLIPYKKALEKRKHIGFLIDGGEGGGIAEYTYLLVKNIDRETFHVSGIFLGPGQSLDMLGPLFDEVIILGSKRLINTYTTARRTKRWLSNAKKGFRAFLYVIRLIKCLRQKEIQCLDISYFPHHLMGGLAARYCGIPSIWRWHSASLYGKGKIILLETGAKYFCTRVIAISDFVRNSLPGEMKKKADVIYGGVDIAAIIEEQIPGFLRKQLSIAPSDQLVIMVGNIVRLKGHEYFIRAAAEVRLKYKKVRFLIIGHEPEANSFRENQLGRLQALITELNCEEYIYFTGQIPKAYRHFSECSMLCMPTISVNGVKGEAFGLALVEAMAAGIAVISSDAGAFEEIISNEKNGLIVPQKNKDAMAEAILRLLLDESERIKLADAGRQTACGKFNIKRMVLETESMYEKICRP